MDSLAARAAARDCSPLLAKFFGGASCGLEARAVQDRVSFCLTMQGV